MLLTSSQLLLLLALIINEDEGSFFHNPKTAHTALKNKKTKTDNKIVRCRQGLQKRNKYIIILIT